jgi:CheY-like chemotaxis protein
VVVAAEEGERERERERERKEGLIPPATKLGEGQQTRNTESNITAMAFKMLLVEDVSINRALIRLWLLHEFSGLHIVDASNGKEALEELQSAKNDGAPFDIVLMDISMPIMDGFACLEEMTELYGDQRPPTIAISTGITHENPAREPGTGAKFDQWWDKTDENALLGGMKKLMQSMQSH